MPVRVTNGITELNLDAAFEGQSMDISISTGLVNVVTLGRLTNGYAVAGFSPPLVMDFTAEYYRVLEEETTFESAITATRASSATYTDSSGLLVTALTNEPRRSHHVWNGMTWVNKGFLVEPTAATNLITSSAAFTNAFWVGTTSNVVVVDNVVSGPDGLVSASTVTEDSTTNIHNLSSDIYGTCTAGVPQTFSFFGKANGRDWVQIYSGGSMGLNTWGNFNIASGSTGNSGAASSNLDIEQYAGGWFRCSVTFTPPTTGAYFFQLATLQGDTALRSPSFLGDGVSGFYAFGAQDESGSVPTSYITTAGATATRAADIVTVPAANLPYDATNMSIQMDGLMTYADNDSSIEARFFNWFSDSSNNLSATLATTAARTGAVYFTQEASGVADNVFGPDESFTPGANVPFNIASRHGSTFINGAVDGVALTANLTPTALPDLSAADMQLVSTGGPMILKTFRMWPNDLGDAGIAAAST